MIPLGLRGLSPVRLQKVTVSGASLIQRSLTKAVNAIVSTFSMAEILQKTFSFNEDGRGMVKLDCDRKRVPEKSFTVQHSILSNYLKKMIQLGVITIFVLQA